MAGGDKGCSVTGSLHATACQGELATRLGEGSSPRSTVFCVVSSHRSFSACFPISRGVPESASSFSFCFVFLIFTCQSPTLQCYFTRLGFLGNVHSAFDPERKKKKKVRVSFFFDKFHLFLHCFEFPAFWELGTQLQNPSW